MSPANPLLPGSRKRTKGCIAEVRHLYIDIDVDGDNRIAALMESEIVPMPTAILSTSSDKYQALWSVEGFDFDQQENTLKLLAIAFGGDSACTDRNRVLRVAWIPQLQIRSRSPGHGRISPATPHIVQRTSDWMIQLSIRPSQSCRDATNHTTGKNTPLRAGLGVGCSAAIAWRGCGEANAITRFPALG